MEFKSQICTTKEQSQRLLELGLEPETADMKIIPYSTYVVPKDYDIFLGYGQDAYTPSWSLHRLIEMCNKTQFGMTISIYFDNTYDNLISIIEWLIQLGHFKKEYLNEK